MNKIIAFSTSTSRHSINGTLVAYGLSLLENADKELLDLRTYFAPLYSIDEETENGIPSSVHELKDKLVTADAFILGMAEHNGNFTAAFKNLYDWLSRIDTNIFGNKKILLLGTSPGPSGASNVLSVAEKSFPWMGGEIAGIFSLPQFTEHFKEGRIIESSYNSKFIETIKSFESQI